MKAFMRYSAGILVTSMYATAFCQTDLTSSYDDNRASNQAIAPPTLSIEQLASPVMAGSLVVLNITVGTASEPISDLFGLSFELVYSNDAYLEFIEPVEAAAGPFLQPDTYTFTRHEPANRILYLAVSRKRGASGQDGFGLVLTLPVKIKDAAPPGWQTCFAIHNSSANDPQGTSIPLANGDPMCIVVDDGLTVIPNPFTPNGDGANDYLEFRRDGGVPADWEIVIMDQAGRSVKRLTGGANAWNGKDEQNRTMLPGTYLYVIRSTTRVVKRGLLWLIL